MNKTYFVKDDPPLPEDDENKEKRTDDISSWDVEFLKVALLFNATESDIISFKLPNTRNL